MAPFSTLPGLIGFQMDQTGYIEVTEANAITAAGLGDALKNDAVERISITRESDGHFYLYAKLNWKGDPVKLRFNAIKRGFWDFRSLDTAWTFLTKLPPTDTPILLTVTFDREDTELES